MSTILTITFSPCIDKSTSVQELQPEKKLRCSVPRTEPGGGGINVARAIVRLGGDAVALYPTGGYTGKAFDQLLANEKVPAIAIEVKNETRENIIVLETSTNKQFRLGMPGAEVTETEWRQMLKVVEEMKDIDFIVASGSLPPGAPLDLFAQVAMIARREKAKFIVDTSGEALKYAVEEGVYMIKPNLSELSYLAGKECLQPSDIVYEAKKIIAGGHCEIIVVSLGAMGAMLITKDENILFSPPAVSVKSTVGAGDSMVAGIVVALSIGKNIDTAVQYGVACGTAATMNPGTELCHKEDADKLFDQIRQLHQEPILP